MFSFHKVNAERGGCPYLKLMNGFRQSLTVTEQKVANW